MNKTFKRLICLVSVVALLAGALAGCGGDRKPEDGKTKISIGNWPSEDGEPERYAQYQTFLEKWNEKYPNVEIEQDAYDYNLQTFLVRAASNQLPLLYRTWYTEIQKIIKAGYAKDITDIMTERGFKDGMNPDVLELCSNDGKIYATPTDGYAQGFVMNRPLFEKAGLVNADGSVKVPQTWDEVAEFAKIIKEKTGEAGFAFPAKGNIGGWHFMNIAWSFGVEFMKQDKDGKYISTFNTPEAEAAFQYLYDLKWKYNALQDNALIDRGELNKLMATDKAGMIIADPPADDMPKWLDMDIKNMAYASIPAGPKGRFTQMGGNVRMVAVNADEAQTEAIFDWIEFTGEGPELNDDSIEALKSSLQYRLDAGLGNFHVVPFKMWTGEERLEKENEIRKDYVNVEEKDYAEYVSFEGVTIKPEEPAACQELYTILDSCIQEVFTNKDVDIPALLEKANSDMQKNHLDKLD